MISTFDRDMMALALRLAKRGLNSTTPNPRVGCVIVDRDRAIVGSGFHQQAGLAHAEIIALENAGDAARGADVYVTLEPCSHHGKTGPCAEALISAGVRRVVFAMGDPNPEVSGGGLQKLRQAGVDVEGPLLEESARALNKGFIKRMAHAMPYVRCKMAMSLDGRTAMASGESKWITGPAAREDVQHWRAQSCAIITGVNSVIHDDPALTVRLEGHTRQPLRLVLDTQGRCPQHGEILSQPGETIIVASESAVVQTDHTLWRLPLKDNALDLRELLRRLADRGCNEILVETGATLAGAFVAAGLVDEFLIYVAPKLLGSHARPLFNLPIENMNGQLSLIIDDVRAVGEDWRITARPDTEA